MEKTREIDNEARISEKAEMKRKLNRNQKPWDSVRYPAKLIDILGVFGVSLNHEED